jgi:hypothetical protein
MKTRKKEIASVELGEFTEDFYPCLHEVTIKYKDGSEQKKYPFGDVIAKKYLNYLDESNNKHFAKYLDQSGLFGVGYQTGSDSEPESNDFKNERPDNCPEIIPDMFKYRVT